MENVISRRSFWFFAAFLLAAAVLLALAFTVGLASAVPCTPGDPGDSNEDGNINAGDLTHVEHVILGTFNATNGSDANLDTAVNATDLGVIEYMILEIWPFNVVHLEVYDEDMNPVTNVAERSNFSVVVHISYVDDLDSGNYDVIYNSTFLDVTNITNGSVLESGTSNIHTVDVASWGFIPPAMQGRVRIINNIPGIGGVSGSGYLAKLHFYVNTSQCLSSDIDFFVGNSTLNLFDSGTNPIPGVTWVNTSMDVFPCDDF